ncbi:helix-turn-helix domain-containing protein [Natrarchaeobaculum aegyptiacum]|uniref:Transcriptional regulator n=1 Tax=Natrarchaeobaculum aegyptiacum TaxID=745377 RepID=A0A2Z2HXY4_9EURY|nr:helix-turn-helix domain-containing protein [Natrarchaeobaculum aegyptiacum]ARS91155.1 transcriptional regulator [Natrarchaeobaculum aegyptiacum]
MVRDDGDDRPGGDDGSSEGDVFDDERGYDPVEDVDQRVVDLLSWILDTETRAKIYVYLLANPGSTSEEVATGTGLYPSTVREALAELHEEDRVTRTKRESEGAGNNPYEYRAIQPSDLVGGVVDQVQQELNTIFTLDRVLERDEPEPTLDSGVEPVTITVEDADSTVDDAPDDSVDVQPAGEDAADESDEDDEDDEDESSE